jgi:hypothetical protein
MALQPGTPGAANGAVTALEHWERLYIALIHYINTIHNSVRDPVRARQLYGVKLYKPRGVVDPPDVSHS